MTEIAMAAGIENVFATTPCQNPPKNKRAYRREMKTAKNDQLLEIINYGGYHPEVGYVDYGFDGPSLLHSGKHIKYPKSSHRQRMAKRATSKITRKQGDVPAKGNFYRRLFDYKWSIH